MNNAAPTGLRRGFKRRRSAIQMIKGRSGGRDRGSAANSKVSSAGPRHLHRQAVAQQQRTDEALDSRRGVVEPGGQGGLQGRERALTCAAIGAIECLQLAHDGLPKVASPLARDQAVDEVLLAGETDRVGEAVADDEVKAGRKRRRVDDRCEQGGKCAGDLAAHETCAASSIASTIDPRDDPCNDQEDSTACDGPCRNPARRPCGR